MFAVIRTGGKQYKVARDARILIEKLDAKVGDRVTLSDVLMVCDGDKTTVGAPVIAGASVIVEVLEETRGPKVIIFKKRRRQNSRRKNGHRQDLTLVKVTDIKAA
jgi:large subunit ribosomal protein L21